MRSHQPSFVDVEKLRLNREFKKLVQGYTDEFASLILHLIIKFDCLNYILLCLPKQVLLECSDGDFYQVVVW